MKSWYADAVVVLKYSAAECAEQVADHAKGMALLSDEMVLYSAIVYVSYISLLSATCCCAATRDKLWSRWPSGSPKWISE